MSAEERVKEREEQEEIQGIPAEDGELSVMEDIMVIRKRVAVIRGNVNGERVSSRTLEELIQQAVQNGARGIHIQADGQHGIASRIWPRAETVKVTVEGAVGHGLGSVGMFKTEIVVKNSASDDVGWFNCGAKITVLGDVGDRAFCAATHGLLYVQGSGGARCDAMTRHNPGFDPPQSWYFRDVGDSFAEFKAGGIAVVCGVNPRRPGYILGHQPCVGMTGGVVYLRGQISGYSERDVRLLDLTEQDWAWLKINMKPFLKSIDRLSFYDELTSSKDEWKRLVPCISEKERRERTSRVFIEMGADMHGDERDVFDNTATDLPHITTNVKGRYKARWMDRKYSPPCEHACPSGIPIARYIALISAGRLQDAVDLILQYTPLPATVCGEICPKPCMDACTRVRLDRALNMRRLGKASLKVESPHREHASDKRVGVIGGGPAGLSTAWQLSSKGYGIDLYEAGDRLGGKIEFYVPRKRLPRAILRYELDRFMKRGIKVHLNTEVDTELFRSIYDSHDAVVIACGAQKPRRLDVVGAEDMVTAYDLLRAINMGKRPRLKDKSVVIIGAGSVGMDVAAEAFYCGARDVTVIDIQGPTASVREMKIARSLGTRILWPRSLNHYDKHERRVYFKDGTSLEADLVVVSIGELPMVDFLPPTILRDSNGWIEVDALGHTSDPRVYAVGEVVRAGDIAHVIGDGRRVAESIHASLSGVPYYRAIPLPPIPHERIKTGYYDICRSDALTPKREAGLCMSCAVCMDCRMCEATCYYGAISRIEDEDGSHRYMIDDNRCTGCGFCADICPSGIWEMVDSVSI